MSENDQLAGVEYRKIARSILFPALAGAELALDARMAEISETHDYDPRYDRAQTIEGAKARYVSDDQEYGIDDYERDLERILAHD